MMPTAPRLVVIGSANMDLVVRAERIAAPGETVLGGRFVTAPGGKGANQAVAAARLGGAVAFVGRLGLDAFGDALLAQMTDAGIDTSHIVRDEEQPTGVALIVVDAGGQNAISVAPGANHRLSTDDLEAAREAICGADHLVIQLEIPLEVVRYAIQMAADAGTRVILNPAPANPAFPAELLQQVEVITPNEHEACGLLGIPFATGTDWEPVAMALRDRGPRAVIVTLGAEGCVLADASGVRRLPAVPVAAVDTTAAGDCFTGALAVALGEGLNLDSAARFASRAAAVSVTRAGAQPSLPVRSEISR